MANIVVFDKEYTCKAGYDILDAITTYSKWSRVTNTCWILYTDDDCTTVRDNLLEYLIYGSFLFVAKLTGEAAWRWD